MKSLMLFILFLIASVSYGATYKWEDSSGVHYSDNPKSLPKQYQVDSQEPIPSAVKQPVVNVPQQYNVMPNQNTMVPSVQASAEQEKLALERMKRQQAASYAQAQKNAALAQQKAIKQLSTFMTILCIIAGLLLIDWIWALIHILNHEFVNPSNKVVWLLLVLMLPVLGVILYRFIGRAQTVNDYNEQEQLLARLTSNSTKSGDFDIN